MTNDEFARRIVEMQGTLWRVSCTILRQEADREDAVQSCIERAWRKRTLLRDEGKFAPWVTRILINECYGILRRYKRETPVEAIPDMPAPPTANHDLYRFFTGLPEKLRLPMVLHYVEGHDLKTIAAILHLPLGTVKTRLMRGREHMKRSDIFKEVQEL